MYTNIYPLSGSQKPKTSKIIYDATDYPEDNQHQLIVDTCTPIEPQQYDKFGQPIIKRLINESK